jgi:hypothetical protein
VCLARRAGTEQWPANCARTEVGFQVTLTSWHPKVEFRCLTLARVLHMQHGDLRPARAHREVANGCLSPPSGMSRAAETVIAVRGCPSRLTAPLDRALPSAPSVHQKPGAAVPRG